MSSKLTPESLWEKIDSLMRSSSTEQIRNPTGQVKKCLEEWLPIYHYCIKRRRLGLSLTVQLDESEEYPDAVVELNGFDSEVINVEVAFVKDYEDALRSELLNDSGWCPGVGPISRDKISGDILAEMHAYSGGSIAAKTYQSIRDRVLKKVEKKL